MDKQLSIDLEEELIVDNFAGGGGASTGIAPNAAAIIAANVPELKVERVAA